MIIILVPNQLIETVWNNFTKQWYIDKGYKFTKHHDTLIVKAEDLSPYGHQQIQVICDYCGKEYTAFQSTHTKGITKYPYKDCCYNCQSQKNSEVTLYKRIEKFWGQLEIACEKKGYKLLSSKDEYTTKSMKIRYICPKHGEQIGRMDTMIEQGSGCHKCKNELITQRQTLNKDNVEYQINKYNNNILLNKDDYINNHTYNLKIKCGLCNKNIFTTCYSDYMTSNVRCCKSCSAKTSKSEIVIKELLERMNISFIDEKCFDDCKDKRKLPFDFYLPTYNLCIEFDGEQHYYPVNHGGMSNEKAKQQFERNQQHDQIKNEYCQTHNIELLRIPYWEKDNIEQIITDKLNELDRRYSLVS